MGRWGDGEMGKIDIQLMRGDLIAGVKNQKQHHAQGTAISSLEQDNL
ncbi:MAG: hypothetical protein F6K36_09655 [Symploca sp. SIO3C6]|uniref:Uncharacterized protein n=1 Tax=Symploca sp. SIO1C4 TaxID=2607765 RepID=A0A6B3NPR3_9CYAN|nr:hypothetical protein [Symploca sp. SIO3C6]NER32302.1 hypothetical protein [Symploca sp. SIO1C4]NET53243.1 hypothetical protein [Merismopedia sp. SIO2A8]